LTLRTAGATGAPHRESRNGSDQVWPHRIASLVTSFQPGAAAAATPTVTLQGMVSRVPPQAVDIHPPFDECLEWQSPCTSKTVVFTSKPRPTFIGIPVDYNVFRRPTWFAR
jgi:hypothetical protein